MPKEFDQWNHIKKEIHTESKAKMFSEREIWWCSLGVNIGHEEDAFSRPCIVLRKFNSRLFLSVPLTTKIKDNFYYYKIYSS